MVSGCGSKSDSTVISSSTTFAQLFNNSLSTTTILPLQVPGWSSQEFPELRAEAGNCVGDATPGAVEIPDDGPAKIVVEPGDTLGKIAKRFEVTVDAFMRANDLDDPNRLQVGQELFIPHQITSDEQVMIGPQIVYLELVCVIDTRVAAFGPDTQPIGGSGAIEVNMSWPRIEGPREAPKVNGRLRGLVQADASAFFEEVISSVEKNGYACRNSFDRRCMWLQHDYEIMLATDGYLSIRNTARWQMPGAVSTLTEIRTITFDLSTGRPIVLEELFDPSTDWLSALSGAVIERLEGEPWVDQRRFDGAGPNPRNFSRFTLTEGGLGMSFAPLSVGGSGTNTLSITIPYRTLEGFWSASGPIPMLG
tara:strand:+ start:242 stop:1333 length:1092 start_codon:yes stop_codon:yes gene_type:complete